MLSLGVMEGATLWVRNGYRCVLVVHDALEKSVSLEIYGKKRLLLEHVSLPDIESALLRAMALEHEYLTNHVNH